MLFSKGIYIFVLSLNVNVTKQCLFSFYFNIKIEFYYCYEHK